MQDPKDKPPQEPRRDRSPTRDNDWSDRNNWDNDRKIQESTDYFKPSHPKDDENG